MDGNKYSERKGMTILILYVSLQKKCEMRILFILFAVIYSLISRAQIIENPVFDRTDVPSFHIDKIEITKDTTFVYCTYYAEEGSWANISPETYLEDVETGKKYTILGSEGLPFGPAKRDFESNEKCDVRLLFPSIICTKKLNFIENPNESVFNIYGIDLQASFTSKYTGNDIGKFRKLAEESENANDWKSVTKYTLNQLEASKYIFGNNSIYSAYAMFNLTFCFIHANEYRKAIEWGDKAIDVLISLPLDTLNLDFLARAYGNVSTALHLTGEHDLANQYREKSLTIRRSVGDGMTTLNYEQYLLKLANNYFEEENYPKALLYGIEVANIYEKKYKENSNNYGCHYIQALTNLCAYYTKMSQTDNAVKYGKLALNLIEKGGCEDNSIKNYVYNNLAAALISNGQNDEGINILGLLLKAVEIDSLKNEDLLITSRQLLADSYLYVKKDTLKAIDLYKHNLKIIESNFAIGKEDMSNYTTVLFSLYQANKLRDRNIAMQYLNKLINIQKEWNGEESIAYANLLLEYINDTWVETLISKKDVDILMNYVQKASIIIKRHYNNAIYNMSGNLRKGYWQRYENLFTWLIPTISILNTEASNSLAYDAALFYKGILLTSEKELKDVILSSNDSSLVNVYNEYIRNKSHLEEEYNHVSSSFVIDSLKMVIQNEEYLLSQKVTRFNLQNKGTDFSWKDVKGQLKDTDIAIEFVSYELLNGNDIHYAAYVIKKDYDTPLLIPLCFENELLECFKNDSIDYDKLYIVVWGNLQKELEGVCNVYFSTSGLLNTIGIEYLPVEDNIVICDRYNLYRLSSTRELCMSMNKQIIEKAYLYGGLDYNNMISDNRQTDFNNERINRSFIERISQRGEFDKLVGSEQETELIKKELSNKSINCFVLSGKEGTEESFKKLNGSRINIIHMSTHGMYVSSERDSIVLKNNFNFILSDKGIDQEDKALSRSFLVMSGGNILIHRDSIPENSDDGILTALEISHLDFKDLDLVVLSACQTGLGDTNSEGVYGLQRAFKKAGANTILMSLDKVDDEATQILMVEFYKNLMGGKTKHQSFKDAQKYLRSVENGKYDNAKYWASFIMLDGLN